MIEQSRQNGFYWVKWAGKDIIAEYCQIEPDHNWRIPGQHGKFCDCDFTNIDIPENVLTREQYDLANAGNHMLDSFRKASLAYERFMKLNRK